MQLLVLVGAVVAVGVAPSLSDLGLDAAVMKKVQRECGLKHARVGSLEEMECVAARLEDMQPPDAGHLRKAKAPAPVFADWHMLGDRAALEAELSKYNLSPPMLQVPSCEELGYVNIVYNTWSKAQRDEIRARHREMIAHVNLTHQGGEHDDDVYRWLRRRFSVDGEDHPVRIGDEEEPTDDTHLDQSRLARVLFPVHSNTNQGGSSLAYLKEESAENADMILFDAPDSPFLPHGINEGVVLRYFAYCGRLKEPRWQWVVRSEPEMVVNTPHLIYYLRSLDSREIEMNAVNPFPPPLPQKPSKKSVLKHGLYRYMGKALRGMEVIKQVGHQHYEPLYEGIDAKGRHVYPDYMSGRFFIMDRALVSLLGFAYSEMVRPEKTVFNRAFSNSTVRVFANGDAMVGMLVDAINREWIKRRHFVPLTQVRGGIETNHRIYTQAELCGSDYYVVQDGTEFSEATKSRYAAQYRKGIAQHVVNHISECPCDNWIAYPPSSRDDKDKLYTHLIAHCPFRDRFYDAELEWMQQ